MCQFVSKRLNSDGTQIASFVTHTHPESPHIPDDNLQLIGDLLSIHALEPHQTPLNYVPPISAKVHATGTVLETDEGNDTFVVSVWQQIEGLPGLTPLKIRAMMRVPGSFLRPYQPLPAIGKIITFTGNLLTVEDGTAFIGVYDHSFFMEDDIDEFEYLDNLMN